MSGSEGAAEGVRRHRAREAPAGFATYVSNVAAASKPRRHRARPALSARCSRARSRPSRRNTHTISVDAIDCSVYDDDREDPRRTESRAPASAWRRRRSLRCGRLHLNRKWGPDRLRRAGRSCYDTDSRQARWRERAPANGNKNSHARGSLSPSRLPATCTATKFFYASEPSGSHFHSDTSARNAATSRAPRFYRCADFPTEYSRSSW